MHIYSTTSDGYACKNDHAGIHFNMHTFDWEAGKSGVDFLRNHTADTYIHTTYVLTYGFPWNTHNDFGSLFEYYA